MRESIQHTYFEQASCYRLSCKHNGTLNLGVIRNLDGISVTTPAALDSRLRGNDVRRIWCRESCGGSYPQKKPPRGDKDMGKDSCKPKPKVCHQKLALEKERNQQLKAQNLLATGCSATEALRRLFQGEYPTFMN